MNNEEKEKKLVSLISDAVSFRQAQRDKEYLVNRAHFEGNHWNLAENKQDSPFLLRSDINHLKNAVTQRLGSLCADKYWGDLRPLSPNDVENIEKLNTLYRNEWNRLSADDFVEAVIKDGAICDNGYVQVNFDTDKIVGGTNTRREGVITLELLDPSNVYLDPSATKIEDCGYMVVKSHRSKDWIEINKPEWLEKINDKNIKPDAISDSSNGDIYTGRNYGEAKKKSFTITTLYKKERKKFKVDVIDEETGKNKKEEVKRIQVIEYIFIGDLLLETNDKYPFEDFSIIPFQWEPIPQSPYGVPLLRGLTVPQKVANLIESATNNIAMHYTIPTYLVNEESGIDIDQFAKLSNGLGMVWQVNGEIKNAVAQLDPPVVNEQMIRVKDSFVQNIFTYAGVTDAYVGNIGTAGSTAQGTTDAIGRATVIDNPVIKQIEKFVENLSRMIVKFMARYYKNQEVYIRDTQQDGKTFDFKSIKIEENFSDLNYEFYVDLAGRSKTDKNRQYNLMKELYTIQNQYKEDKRIINIPDLVKAARLDNYNEMYKRYSDMSEEAFAEKADLIVQIMSIGQTMTPNGQPLITAEEMQQGIMDVLDDNGSLDSVQAIFNTYKEYETAIADLQNQIATQERQNEINQLQQAQIAQEKLANNILAGYQNMIQPVTPPVE